MSRVCTFLCALLAASCGAGAAAQDAPKPPASDQDIIVTGLPDVGVVPDTAIAPPRTLGDAMRLKGKYEKSQLFARCALVIADDQARQVIDAPPNSAIAKAALAKLESHAPGCLPDRPRFSGNITPQSFDNAAANKRLDQFTDERPPNIDVSLYRRGAILEAVINRFAPDLNLTAKQMADRAVQSRFDGREGARNALRVPEDMRYFNVAVCMVQSQLELAVRLVKSSIGSRAESYIARAIVNRARVCAGSPKRLIVQPVEFRIYITDAVYRWALAARGVDSLIPAEAGAGG